MQHAPNASTTPLQGAATALDPAALQAGSASQAGKYVFAPMYADNILITRITSELVMNATRSLVSSRPDVRAHTPSCPALP